MKNIIGLVVLVVVISGCSMLGKKEETNSGNTGPTNNAPKTESTASPSSDKVVAGLSLESFNKLQNGMKYEDAVKILGGEGVETSSFATGNLKTVTYKWEGENYARITATFRNGELTSKSQSSLKSAGGDTTTAKADLTLAKYNQVQNGMTYDEVVKIVGSEGTQTSSSNSGQNKMASYKWEGEKFARIFATFRNEKLSSKSQSNLK